MRHVAVLLVAAILVSVAPPPAAAEPTVVAKAVEYRDGDVVLEGWLAYDDAVKGKRPGVVVVHEWWGLTDHPKRRAEALARAGYVAFALDMYGKGKVTRDPKQAGEWAGAFRGPGKSAGRSRAKAGYEVLAKDERVDPARIGAMGYCFGGTVSLEMAWSGLPLKGVVSFHGNLTTPDAGDKPTAAVLVCHGADDTFVSDASIRAFEASMKERKVDWTFASYGGAVHSFTNPDADKAGIPGVAYQKKADERSWEHMTAFWRDVFAP
jgi:dienelactone hydrolase